MKIPRDDPRAGYIATNTRVDRDGLAEFLEGRHRWVLTTTRSDGRPQMSLVTGGMIEDGRLAISSYPDQGKCVILIEPTRWGPISTGGFPESLFEDED